MNKLEWSRFRYRMLSTGTYDPDLWYIMNDYQRQWTKDTLNTLKALAKGEGSD